MITRIWFQDYIRLTFAIAAFNAYYDRFTAARDAFTITRRKHSQWTINIRDSASKVQVFASNNKLAQAVLFLDRLRSAGDELQNNMVGLMDDIHTAVHGMQAACVRMRDAPTNQNGKLTR
jgi:hypothetical protein